MTNFYKETLKIKTKLNVALCILAKILIFIVYCNSVTANQDSIQAPQTMPMQVEDSKVVDAVTKMESEISRLRNEMHNSFSDMRSSINSENDILRSSLVSPEDFGIPYNTISDKHFRDWTGGQSQNENNFSDIMNEDMSKYLKFLNSDDTSFLLKYDRLSLAFLGFSFGIAEKSFDRTHVLAEKINFLYSIIDKKTTLKEQADLQSVLLGQIAFLELDLLRLQSIQLKILAMQEARKSISDAMQVSFLQDIKDDNNS